MSSPNLAEILSKINDGILVLSKDRQVLFVNEKASQIMESPDEAFHDRITKAGDESVATRFEHFHAPLNRWFEHHAHPNSDGGLTLVSCDITSRRRIEDALRASEQRFRRVIESDIIGVIMVENGCITEANDVFLHMLKRTREDLVLRQLRWREITPQEFDDDDQKARSEMQQTGVFSPYEKEFLRSDGTRVPVLIGGVSMRDDVGAHETLCIALDLSARKRSEERMRSIMGCGKILASSLEYEKTFPELAEFIVPKLADSCMIFVREDGRLVRLATAYAVPPGPELDLQSSIERVMKTGTAEMTHEPRSRILTPITAGNHVAGALAVLSAKPSAFDTDDLRLFEAIGRRAGVALDNARLYQETQKANRLKDEFVAIISHELRTPLTPILGGVYMIRSEPDNDEVLNRALDLIERNAKTQAKIVDDLLDVSRALTGKLRLNLEVVDLARVIDAAVETVRPAGDAKDLKIDVRITPIKSVVSGDADRLQQVVWNLLSNAVKFTPNAGHITIELEEAAAHAEIKISDNGIGIDADFLPHVFDKFRQANTSRTRPHAGLGLGLAIVRHIVESHGGTVQAYSSGSELGATFVVRLPVRNAMNARRMGS